MNPAKARKVIGDERLPAFLRCLRKERDVLACQPVNEALEARKGASGFTLDVVPGPEGKLLISIGFRAGQEAAESFCRHETKTASPAISVALRRLHLPLPRSSLLAGSPLEGGIRGLGRTAGRVGARPRGF
jgi:hypothetical protein